MLADTAAHLGLQSAQSGPADYVHACLLSGARRASVKSIAHDPKRTVIWLEVVLARSSGQAQWSTGRGALPYLVAGLSRSAGLDMVLRRARPRWRLRSGRPGRSHRSFPAISGEGRHSGAEHGARPPIGMPGHAKAQRLLRMSASQLRAAQL